MSYLKDFCEIITKGTTPSTYGYSFKNSGIKFIRSENITDSRIISKVSLYISEEANEKLKRSILLKDDVLMSIAGAYLGKLALITEMDLPANTNQAVAIIRTDKSKLNPLYLYYYLSSYKMQCYINNVNAQSAQPNINLQQIGDININVPSLNYQQHIVDTVGSLDDKIENNNKIIIKLEELLNLKFKNIYSDALKTGITINLNDIVNLKTGKKDANAANENGIYPFFTCSEKESNIDVYSFNQEAILIAGNGNMSVKYFNGKFDAYQRTYVISSSKYFYYLYIYYKNFIGNISVGAKGSVIKFLTKSMLLDIDLPILDNITMQRFESDIQKILNYELRLSEENKKLNLLKEKYLKRFF